MSGSETSPTKDADGGGPSRAALTVEEIEQVIVSPQPLGLG